MQLNVTENMIKRGSRGANFIVCPWAQNVPATPLELLDYLVGLYKLENLEHFYIYTFLGFYKSVEFSTLAYTSGS